MDNVYGDRLVDDTLSIHTLTLRWPIKVTGTIKSVETDTQFLEKKAIFRAIIALEP